MKAISLLSDGFDSPIATYLMLKRKIKIYSLNISFSQKNENIIKINEKLKQMGLKKSYVLNNLKIQNELLKNSPSNKLCVLCKRSMFHSACLMAKKLNCEFIITGETLSSKASQTMENLISITSVLKKYNISIIRPLITFNKQDIINLSKKIGLYSLCSSSKKCEFVKNVVCTKSFDEELEKIEEKINLQEKLKKNIANVYEV